MNAELNILQEVAEQVAEIVLQKILPVLESWHAPDQYLNVDELSDMLGKSKAQIYQWVSRARHGLSDFPYQKAGRSLRFSKKEVKKWLETR